MAKTVTSRQYADRKTGEKFTPRNGRLLQATAAASNPWMEHTNTQAVTPASSSAGFNDRALTAMEVAARLGISKWSVWRLIQSGRLKGFRVLDRTWRILESELAAFVRAK